MTRVFRVTNDCLDASLISFSGIVELGGNANKNTHACTDEMPEPEAACMRRLLLLFNYISLYYLVRSSLHAQGQVARSLALSLACLTSLLLANS